MKKQGKLSALFIVLVALVVVLACAPAEETALPPEAEPITIGVLGPLKLMLGEAMWNGAQLAAEEINAAGGISVGGDKRTIRLVKEDTNELMSVPDAIAAAERLVSRESPYMVTGTIKTECAFPIMDLCASNGILYFTTGTGAPQLPEEVKKDYEKYKTWFRVMPINSVKLGLSIIPYLKYGADVTKEAYGLDPKAKLDAAVLVEKGASGDMVYGMISNALGSIGMKEVGAWRPAPDATDLTAELSAIKAADAQIIVGFLYSPLGLPFARQWDELQIPAPYFGTNAEAQVLDFWESTLGKGNYMTSCHSFYAPVAISPKTIPFWNAYVDRFGTSPGPTAATYDSLYLLKDAAEMSDSLDTDMIVRTLEENEWVVTFGRIKWLGIDESYPHDLVSDPGYVYPIGVQWVDGELRCIWPYDFMGVTYEGTKKAEVAPWAIEYWKDKL